MKATFLSLLSVLALLVTHAFAEVQLGGFPRVVDAGKTYRLNWTATANYTYTIWLVRDNPENTYSWKKIANVCSGLTFESLSGDCDWTVPSDLNATRDYGLWLNAFSIPFNGASFNNLTPWFRVSSSGTPAQSSAASATPTATSTAMPGASPGNSHHSGISGGAIAGIVIGCIFAIALGIGALLFFSWRRKRTGIQKREAAARASRLAPVMEESSPEIEMNGNTPTAPR